jgi:hypothetical protein
MNASRRVILFCLIFLFFVPKSFSEDQQNVLSTATVAVVRAVGKIWDANAAVWSKINTVQVNIAIDNLRDKVNGLDRDKQELKGQIEQGKTTNYADLSSKISSLETSVRGLRDTLLSFANAIDQAAGSALIGDEFSSAANHLANDKLLALENVRSKWSVSHAAAASQLETAIADNNEILRALGCLQDTIKRGSKPEHGCDFPQHPAEQ